MPYYRRRVKRYGRKRYRKRPTGGLHTAMQIARTAYRGVKFIKGLVNVEKHYQDTTVNQTVANTGSVILLSGIAQGDDVNNRQGNSILAKTLYCRFYVQRDVANTSVANYVRCIIAKDLENTGSTPSISDLLTAVNVTSALNVDHTARYQILMDKVYALSLNGTMCLSIKKFIKINDHLKYTGSAATDVYKNNIYLFIVASEASNLPYINGNFRISWYDN